MSEGHGDSGVWGAGVVDVDLAGLVAADTDVGVGDQAAGVSAEDRRGGEVGGGVLGHGCFPFGLVMGAPVSAGCAGTGGVARATPQRPRRTEQGFRPPASRREALRRGWGWAEKVTWPVQFGAGVG